MELALFAPLAAAWVWWCAAAGWGLDQCVLASIAAALYAIRTAERSHGVVEWWGVRTSGAVGGAMLAGLFALVASPVAYWLGGHLRGVPPMQVTPVSYFGWCLTQDFILCCFVAAHLDELVPNRVAAAILAGAFFGAGHLPYEDLVVLTFAAGTFWSWLFLATRSLWPVVVMHWIFGMAVIAA